TARSSTPTARRSRRSSCSTSPADASAVGGEPRCGAPRTGVVSPAVTDDVRDPSEQSTPTAKRILLGDPLTSEQLDGQALPKRRALPIFASDALSSVAYAPQELLMILAIGGTAF